MGTRCNGGLAPSANYKNLDWVMDLAQENIGDEIQILEPSPADEGQIATK